MSTDSSAAGNPSASPGPILRLGIVGLGRAAANMLPALVAHPCVAISGAADTNPAARARFEREFPQARAYPSAEALCASGDVDAVYIATPHEDHAPSVAVAARHHRHVLVEKPMALTLDECRAIGAAVERADIALVVGHTHAFDPPIAAMGELIRSGRFGRLRTIVNLVYTDFLYRPRRPEELDSARGGGILYNQVPHQIDILRTLSAAPVERVRAVAGVWDPARRTEGALAAFVEFADGAVAQLTYSGYDRFDSDELTFWVGESGEERPRDHHGATRRALRAAADTPDAEQQLRTAGGYAGSGMVGHRSIAHEQHFGFLLASCDEADLRPAPDGVLIYDAQGVSELPTPRGRVYPNKDAVIDEFYAAATGLQPPVHDAGWGTATMAIALAIVESSRTGREVWVEEYARRS